MATYEELSIRTPERRRSGGEHAEVEAPMVVVPLDGSERSLVALPVARALAELEGATLHVLHVSERIAPPRELIERLGVPVGELGGLVFDEVAGQPGEQIVEYAGRSPDSRIVMAAHTEATCPSCELGPVTDEVLRNARCPVMLVRPERGVRPWQPRRVLVPHDGSPRTAQGFGPSFELARLAEAQVFVLHVATMTGEAVPGQLPVPPYVDQPQYEWPEWSREFLERLEMSVENPIPSDIEPRLFLSKGEPGDEILRFAQERDVDVIALAWHGSLASAHAQTVKKVILNAPCPVLFVHVHEAEAGQEREQLH